MASKKDVDHPRTRGWQDCVVGVPVLVCPFCDLGKQLPVGIKVETALQVTGHLLVSETQSDDTLSDIKNCRCWKEIRLHARRCHAKRVLKDNPEDVEMHLIDKILWETNLSPLWVGRRLKYSVRDSKLNGKPNQRFYHAQAKARLEKLAVEKYLKATKDKK